jgi:hypothetical protein
MRATVRGLGVVSSLQGQGHHEARAKGFGFSGTAVALGWLLAFAVLTSQHDDLEPFPLVGSPKSCSSLLSCRIEYGPQFRLKGWYLHLISKQ